MRQADQEEVWKTSACLALFGGGVSVVGDIAIRAALQRIPNGSGASSWQELFPGAPWMSLAFLSGFISVGLLAPAFVRKITLTNSSDAVYSRYGILFGALAGVVNVVIFASMHLSLFAYGGIKMGNLHGLTTIFSLFLTYLPIAVLIMGVPAAIIGASAGIATEISLRRFRI